MKYYLLLILIAVIFVSGCITSEKTAVSSVGLNLAIVSDTKQPKPSMPVTFILKIKNLASESAKDISVELLNLTDWRVENTLQHLDELIPNDLYKFSWIAYSPSNANRTFSSVANVFYKMETNAKLKLRIYDNNYLNTLKTEEKQRIKEGSALISSTISKNTPVAVSVSIQQPFILTQSSQIFSFVIEIKNAGLGKPSSDGITHPTREGKEQYVKFGYASNSSIECDFEDGELVRLVSGSQSIACRLKATQDEVGNYVDIPVDFSIRYSYLDKISMKIEVK